MTTPTSNDDDALPHRTPGASQPPPATRHSTGRSTGEGYASACEAALEYGFHGDEYDRRSVLDALDTEALRQRAAYLRESDDPHVDAQPRVIGRRPDIGVMVCLYTASDPASDSVDMEIHDVGWTTIEPVACVELLRLAASKIENSEEAGRYA